MLSRLIVALSSASFPSFRVAIPNVKRAFATTFPFSLLKLTTLGYRNAKRDSLLVYYKDLILLEDKIVHYQYEAIGFVDAPKGQKVVQDIITLYLSTVKLSYMQIDMKNNKGNL